MTNTYLHKINDSRERDVIKHFTLCEKAFISEIELKIQLTDYITKIILKATSFEVWDNQQLVGLLAVYIDSKSRYGYITNVSVIPQYYGRGIAKSLLDRCCEYLWKKGIMKLSLEVKSCNSIAIGLYTKIGFVNDDKAGSYQKMSINLKGSKYDR